ncbi:MAG TPA: response regulator transcription factor [Ktedonobacterales bacterium]|nr:response regulator transcription factor [Ktedonobacterales bacterium]
MREQPQKVLVAEDEQDIQRFMALNLTMEGYEVLTADDGEQALELARTSAPDVIILDVMMPKLDGFEVCERVRAFSSVPIIFVTTRGEESARIRGLDLGADDYLVKPVSIPEMYARVRAVLRRAAFNPTPPVRDIETLGDITVDHAQHTVTLKGEPVAVTPIEYAILTTLMRQPGVLVTSDALLETVWGSEYAGETHILQVNVHRLRRKIEADPAHPTYILTQPGVGYRMPMRPANGAA